MGGFLAERVGFEPTVPFGTPTFQASALGQTMLPLRANDILPLVMNNVKDFHQLNFLIHDQIKST